MNDAIWHLQAIIGSHAPKHENKMAGVAYLASEFFDAVEIDGVEKEKNTLINDKTEGHYGSPLFCRQGTAKTPVIR